MPRGSPLTPADLVEVGAPVPTKRSDPPVHQLRAGLDTRLRSLLAHDPGTRDGSDPEDLHKMRVAVRRMRAALKAARPMLDAAWADDLRAELGWLGRALGPVRDADVQLARLRDRAEAFDDEGRAAVEMLLAGLVAERDGARAELLAVLRSERYPALLQRLAAAVAEPLPTAGTERPPTLITLTGQEYRKLRKAAERVEDTAARQAGGAPDEALHALRIRAKRVRYTAELAATSGDKAVRKLVTATTALQDVLGEHQDACVARDRVVGLLDRLGDVVDFNVVFTAGRLVEREEDSRAAARQDWPAAWRRVRKRARTADLSK